MVLCHAGGVGAHYNPRTFFTELQLTTGDVFSCNHPHVSIYGTATYRSMDRVVDAKLLRHVGHMLLPKISHGRPTDEDLICEVVFGSCFLLEKITNFAT